MKAWYIMLALPLAIGALAACGGSEPTAAPIDAGLGDTYTSEALDVSYPNALSASSQLMLGTLKLEGTEHAITVEQATSLLPLWQAFEADVLQSSTERNAVVAQIEAEMTSVQLEVISAMRLAPEDLRSWAEERGLGMQFGGGQRSSSDAQATRQPRFSGQDIPPEMATRRAQFEGMSEEQRAAFRATVQAGGGFAGLPGGAAARSRQPLFLLRPLIELLELRAAGAE